MKSPIVEHSNKIQIEELQRFNEDLRDILNDFLFVNETSEQDIKDFWLNVNALINNEIKQEELCNN